MRALWADGAVFARRVAVVGNLRDGIGQNGPSDIVSYDRQIRRWGGRRRNACGCGGMPAYPHTDCGLEARLPQIQTTIIGPMRG